MEAVKRVRDGAIMEDVMVSYDEEILERGSREIAIAIPAMMASHSASTFANGPLAKMGLKQKTEGN